EGAHRGHRIPAEVCARGHARPTHLSHVEEQPRAESADAGAARLRNPRQLPANVAECRTLLALLLCDFRRHLRLVAICIRPSAARCQWRSWQERSTVAPGKRVGMRAGMTNRGAVGARTLD